MCPWQKNDVFFNVVPFYREYHMCRLNRAINYRDSGTSYQNNDDMCMQQKRHVKLRNGKMCVQSNVHLQTQPDSHPKEGLHNLHDTYATCHTKRL